MANWVIVPVKPLSQGKTRLAHVLTVTERADLLRGFLDRALHLLGTLPEVDVVLVVSSDPAVHTIARSHQARVLMEPYPQGLNTAVTNAVHHATSHGAKRVLILPADLPFVQAADVAMMLHAARGLLPQLVICPDQVYTGTNALLLQAPPPEFVFRYGRGSFTSHEQEAHRHQMTVHIVETPGLMFDLDTEADWYSYQTACCAV